MVNRQDRYGILKDTVRYLKPDALVYASEFSYIQDEDVFTSTGKRWVDVYKQDFSYTGEYGSVIVQNPDGSPKFIGHHFQKAELQDLLSIVGIRLVGFEQMPVISVISGSKRNCWATWGYKDSISA